MSKVGTTNKAVRDEWVKKSLDAIPQGAKILDAGAGERQYQNLCSHLKYVSQDFGRYDGEGDGAGLHTKSWDTQGVDIVGDICDIPAPDESFDAVMCTEVLEHLPEPTRALEEFARLLKPGGTILLTAPFCSLTHFSPFHFHSGFNQHYYRFHLERLGFQIKEISANGGYFDYLAQELRRLPHVADQYCGRARRPLLKLAARLMLLFLGKLARSDSGSNELLCFGYHVLAVKSGKAE